MAQQWIVKRAGAGTGGGLFWRTLLLKDTTVASDVADHVTAMQPGVAQRVTAVLRKAITADLVVRVNLNGAELIVATIPAATAVDSAVVTTITGSAINLNDVFSWDVTASDGSKDAAGVAAFTVEWA